MWQQMLILILLVWIVGASVVPTVAVTTMRIEATSSALPNRNNNSVILSEKNVERKNLSGSAPEQQKGGNTTGNVTESSGSSDSSEVIQAPDQSESKSLVQKDHISKDKNTESPNTTIDRGNLTEVSSYPPDVKEPNNNTTVDSDTKADNIQNNRDLEPNDTDHKVGKGNDQEDNENTDKQSNISSVGDPYLLVGDESGQTSNNTSEKEKEGNIIKMVSTTESSGSSGSLDSPPLDKTIQVEYPKLPKKPSTSATTTTTVAADISNEEYLKSPIQGMDEIGDVDNSSQSSAMKNVPVSDEKHDIQDLQEGKEEFDENTVGNEKELPIKVDNGGKFSDDEDSHFFAYFLTIMVTAIIFYLIFHNKQRIIALIIEGRAPNTRGRRSSRKVRYHKLDNNLEEAITATKGANQPSCSCNPSALLPISCPGLD